MVTRLDKELRREIDIDGAAYVVRISEHGLSSRAKRSTQGHRAALEGSRFG